MVDHSLSKKEMRSIWFEEWRFTLDGMPDDAAIYIYSVLTAISSPPHDHMHYVNSIGGLEGQQRFMFLWLQSAGLVTQMWPEHGLTEKGQRILASMEDDTFFEWLRAEIDASD